jgi:hypothetical protein
MGIAEVQIHRLTHLADLLLLVLQVYDLLLDQQSLQRLASQ